MLTISIETVDALDLGVLVHAEVEPRESDWERIVERWGRFTRRVRSRGKQPLCLVISRGGEGPNANQRRALDAINSKARPRVAVATGSSVARGIVTAISWFGHTEIRAFHPDDLEGALRFLGIPPSERATVEGAVAAAQAQLTAARTG